MSVEIMQNERQFGPSIGENTKAPVLPIPLHDLESIYWVLLWTLLSRTKVADTDTFARNLFRNDCTADSGALKQGIFTKAGRIQNAFTDDPIYGTMCRTFPQASLWQPAPAYGP